MNKVFVVPKDLGERTFGKYVGLTCVGGECAVGHLGYFLAKSNDRLSADSGYPVKGFVGEVHDLLKEYGYSRDNYFAATDELIVKNDCARTSEERREVMIKWLRKYFPDCEVKNG